MCIYTMEILESKIEENNANIFKLQSFIESYVVEIEKNSIVIKALDNKLNLYKIEVSKPKENELSSIVTESLNEKIEIYESELNRLNRIVDESNIIKSDYIFELNSLKEENQDIKESLELLINNSNKILRGPALDRCGASLRRS